MKPTAPFLLTLAALAASLPAQPVIIYRPVPAVPVVSPLTTPTAQANQSLLTQINGTLTQRRFEHQVLTTNASVRAAAVNAAVRPNR